MGSCQKFAKSHFMSVNSQPIEENELKVFLFPIMGINWCGNNQIFKCGQDDFQKKILLVENDFLYVNSLLIMLFVFLQKPIQYLH